MTWKRWRACWSPDGIDELVGQATVQGPEGVRAFFGELFAAVPDFAFTVEGIVAEGDRVAVLLARRPARSPATPPTRASSRPAARVELRGLDYLTCRTA